MSIRFELFEIIFGQEFIERLAQIGLDRTKICWQIGNETATALKHLSQVKGAIIRGEINTPYAEYILAYGIMDIYRELASLFGVSSRTVRDYHAVTLFYTAEQVERYAELPFSHFRFAMRHGDKAEKILALSLRQKDLNGFRCPSVDWLEANLGRVGLDEDVEVSQELDDSAGQVSIAEWSEQDRTEPLPRSVYYFVRNIRRTMDNMLRRIERIEWPDPERKQKVKSLILAVSDLAEELEQVEVIGKSEKS